MAVSLNQLPCQMPPKKKAGSETSGSKVRERSLVASTAQVCLAIEQIENLDDLRRIELSVKEKRNQLLKRKNPEGQKRRKNLVVTTIHERDCIYEQWRENGKTRGRFLGHVLPPDYDLSLVSISDNVRRRLNLTR